MSDIADVAAHVRSVIDAVPVSSDPGPHLIVRGILPEPYYAHLVNLMPSRGAFQYGDKNKSDFHPLTAPGGPAEDVWRRFETDIVARVLVPALGARLQSAIDHYYRTRFGALAAAVEALPLETRSGRLMLRRPGYRLKPHCDTQIAVVTGLIYFARPGDDESYGTELHRVDGSLEAPSMKTFYPEESGLTCTLVRSIPFTPNTLLAFANGYMAHSANIPRTSAQLERYAYQFYIAPPERRLAEIVERLPAERRAPWFGLQGPAGD